MPCSAAPMVGSLTAVRAMKAKLPDFSRRLSMPKNSSSIRSASCSQSRA